MVVRDRGCRSVTKDNYWYPLSIELCCKHDLLQEKTLHDQSECGARNSSSPRAGVVLCPDCAAKMGLIW